MEWAPLLAIAAPSLTVAGAMLKYVMRVERRLTRIEAKLNIGEGES